MNHALLRTGLASALSVPLLGLLAVTAPTASAASDGYQYDSKYAQFSECSLAGSAGKSEGKWAAYRCEQHLAYAHLYVLPAAELTTTKSEHVANCEKHGGKVVPMSGQPGWSECLGADNGLVVTGWRD
ncbi:hypothetical protein [Streptomyces uncialis]|uniref:hypothetical protein n=1 Tax=Streptomyces uncialis TaxID=1048205 RepID=UPI00378D1C7D